VAATDAGHGALRTALVSACGLLGITGGTARATEVRTAGMVYTEPGRVSAFEAIGDLTHQDDQGRSTHFRLVYDALTGASANGATPASHVQTFTRPSGRGSYQTPAGATPLDDTFRDTRIALSGDGTTNLGRMSTATGGLYVSAEHDYTSLGANAAVTRDFDKRNTTLALRGAVFHDTVRPQGGVPDPLTPMVPPTSGFEGEDEGGSTATKNTAEAGLGLTQVLDRKTVFYAGYTLGHVSGYQTDPYKLLSVVDGTTGDPVRYLYENRPDARTKHIFYTRLVRDIAGRNLQLSYRRMTDDWSIRSDMAEGRLRWNFGNGKYLQPHVRWYHQTAADFYRRWLVDGAALPARASADYRLGDMTTWTFGLMYGTPLSDGRELTVRAEYYRQTGDGHPAEAFGSLRNFDLFPAVDAYIVQVGFNFHL